MKSGFASLTARTRWNSSMKVSMTRRRIAPVFRSCGSLSIDLHGFLSPPMQSSFSFSRTSLTVGTLR
eukprot:8875931-Heterocapsa_arctica.AAC.1